MMNNATCLTNVPLKDIDWGFSHRVPLPENLGLYSIIGAFTALAVWSTIPLTIRLLFTFQRWKGLYFWSILATTWGLNIRAISYLLKFAVPACPSAVREVLVKIGWVGMVSGFSLVLYSRLNLLIQHKKILRLILAMIIVDGVCLHSATITIQIIYNAQPVNDPQKRAPWIARGNTMELVQVIWFTLQQLVISSLYIKAAWDHLQDRLLLNQHKRNIMLLLIMVQILVLSFDIMVVFLDYAGYIVIKFIVHSFIYSIKLELEFVILNQLVEISRMGIPGLTISAMS